MSKQDETWPQPFKASESEEAAALRQYEQRLPALPDQSAVYRRVTARLEHPRARLPLLLTLALGATGVAASVVLFWLPSRVAPVRPAVLPTTSSLATTASSQIQATETVAPRLALGNLPTPLSPGEVELVSGVRVVVGNDASVTARLQDGTLDLVLERGSLAMKVSPREPGQAVLLSAGRHLFTVVGTALRLESASGRLRLTVSEGLVAVSSAGEHVATVASGESWETQLPPVETGSEKNAPRLARRTPERGCERFGKEQRSERIACYRERARKGGPEGERALHALARYLRDETFDLTAALAAFEAQRARFPHGPLKANADRAIIGLLPRLGRYGEALVETQSFLDAQPDTEDRAEIRLLRGDIYRAIYKDAIRAEREYGEGSEGKGRIGDDSRFLHALCLEALGRMNEARRAYRDYLAQPVVAHAEEAQRRMDQLSR